MKQYAARIEALTDADAVLELVWEIAQRAGATGFSYHQSPIFDAPTSRATNIFARGYPLEYQRAYVAEGFRERDPFPALTFEHGPVLAWDKAMQIGARVPGAEEYFAEMRRRGMVNGVGLALYGPRNRDAYVTVGFDIPPGDFKPGALPLLHSVLVVAHVRICQILDVDAAEKIALSKREQEVLKWIGRGKSSTDIASILNLSPETVRTYTRRVYDKLGVSDRVAATVRALKLGLIEG